MADYFTNISFAFHCTPYEAERLEAVFDFDGEQITDQTEWPEVLQRVWPTAVDFARALTGEPHDDWIMIGVEQYHFDDGGFWIQSSNPNLEAIAIIIQACCPETLSEAPIGFQWSNDCSKPRLDAFGGGCCAIFADRIEFENTSTRLEALLNG